MSIDWRPISGSARPAAADALRLLVVIYYLGQQVKGSDQKAKREIVGEGRLRAFDFLVAQPLALATLVIGRAISEPLADDRRQRLGQGVRQLIHRRAADGGSSRLPWLPIDVASVPWLPLDSALSAVSSRGLMRIATDPSAGLRFQLTGAGSQLVERQVADTEGALSAYRVACDVLLESLPSAPTATMAQVQEWLEAGDRPLAEHCRERQIPLAVDPLPSIYRAAFEQRL